MQTLRTNAYHVHHQDKQGSIAYITGDAGTAENCYAYDAFGNLLESRENIESRILYTGQQYDQETGQYYLRARFYNPAVGRFMQEDTYRGDGLNLYAYCGNNPLRYYDPSGHEMENYSDDSVVESGHSRVEQVDGEFVNAGNGGLNFEGGLKNKTEYEYLDDQLGCLKDKVKINQYQSAESVNDWWEARGYKSPYKENTVVQNITLIEDTKFVRVYDGENSSLEGGWVMRVEDIKGLTSKEIQAKFALEYEPKYIGEVELKAGDTIRLGEVGPNFGFNGGGIQIDLQQQWIGDFTELGKIEDWS